MSMTNHETHGQTRNQKTQRIKRTIEPNEPRRTHTQPQIERTVRTERNGNTRAHRTPRAQRAQCTATASSNIPAGATRGARAAAAHDQVESVPTGSVGGSRAPGSAPPRSHEAHHEISGPPHTCNTTNQVEQPNTDTNRDTNRRPPGSRARANCENTRKSKHTLTPKQVTPEIATARRR